MEKNKLDRFITKYSLAGNANSVKWKTDNNKLSSHKGLLTPNMINFCCRL